MSLKYIYLYILYESNMEPGQFTLNSNPTPSFCSLLLADESAREKGFEELIRPFIFNQEQLDVLSRISDYIQLALVLPTQKKLIITGSAGTGKTSIIIHSIIASWLNNKPAVNDIDYILCAPTNKAKDVMANKFTSYTSKILRDKALIAKYPDLPGKLQKRIRFKTISQVLGINIQINDAGHQEFTKGSCDKVISKYSEQEYDNTVFIIDESSMIDTNSADKLLKLPRPLIFLGDRCQLPPVQEKSSIIFTLENSEKYEVMNLSRVERSTGDIVTASNYLRDLMMMVKMDQPKCLISFIKLQFTLNSTRLTTNIKLYESKPKSWLAEYISRIMSSSASGDMGLTWTNKRCEILNTKVRELLAKSSSISTETTLPLLMEKEKLLIKDAYYSHGYKLYSSMLVTIKSTTPLACPKKYKPLDLLEWLNCIYYGHSVSELPAQTYKPVYKPLDMQSTDKPIKSVLSKPAKKKKVGGSTSSIKTLTEYWLPTSVANTVDTSVNGTPQQSNTNIITVPVNPDLETLRPAWPATNNYNKTCQFACDGFIPMDYIDNSPSATTLLMRFIDYLDLSPDDREKIYSRGMRMDMYRDYHMFASQYLFDIPVDKLCCPLCQFLSPKLYALVQAHDTCIYKMINLVRNIELECLQCVTTCGKRMNILTQAGRTKFLELEMQVHVILQEAIQRKIQLNRTELVAFRQLLNDEGSSLLSAGIYGSTGPNAKCSISLSYILGHYWNHCFKDVYANWDYGYFITVHKSQGSDYDNVFLDYHDLMNNGKPDERARLIYTGLTRTRNMAHIYYNPE